MNFSLLLRTARNIIIPAFCLWHMFAIAVYAIPTVAQDQVALFIKKNIQPVVIPYLLATSQWQQWNLFSPDPMRRVSTYTLVADIAGERRAVHAVTPTSSRWWQTQDDITSIRRFEEVGESALPILERFTAEYCRPLNLPLGTPLRFVISSAELPRVGPSDADDWWKNWQPQWTNSYEWPTVNCPSEDPIADVSFP